MQLVTDTKVKHEEQSLVLTLKTMTIFTVPLSHPSPLYHGLDAFLNLWEDWVDLLEQIEPTVRNALASSPNQA